MASATVRLFVYGSLKRGGLHHDELTALGALFVGEAETLPGYRLEALGEYLALVPVIPPAAPTAADTQIVRGELFEVPEAELPALDAFEGDAYARGVVKVRLQPSQAAKPRHQAEERSGEAAKPRHQAEERSGEAATPGRSGEAAKPSEESLAYFKKAR